MVEIYFFKPRIEKLIKKVKEPDFSPKNKDAILKFKDQASPCQLSRLPS